jgi:23S rRNA (adenine2030-N6)-methyltransferase
MLSYRHGFHAGNTADVLKHTVLAFCLDYLTQKDKPFLYVDTHAGAGSYALLEGFAAQNREWEQGIARMAVLDTADRPLPALLERYHGIISRNAAGGTRCPGSPVIAAEILRSKDRAVCFELHPVDFALLKEYRGGDRRFILRNEDGIRELKGLLPPRSRRGLILIDPAYELRDEYAAVLSAVREALRRFASGVFIIWYPLLGRTDKGDKDFARKLIGLYGTVRCRVELRFCPNRGGGMYGCGLVLFNPPWTLKPALEAGLPVLAAILGGSEDGWELQWDNPG